MPIYEYHCEDCGKHFEQLVRSSSAKPACPGCEGKRLTRQFSTFAAHNPGGGAGSCPEGNCPLPPGGGCCPGGACNLG
jgi:putative FmdB family regulatory protein